MIKSQDESQHNYDEQFQQSLDQNKSKNKNQEVTIFVPNVNESFNIDNCSKSYQRQHIVEGNNAKIGVKQIQQSRKTKSNSSVDQLIKTKNTCPVILSHKNKKSDQNISKSANSNQNNEKDPQSSNFQPKAHQFKRTNFSNQRRSLHLMIKNHNEANIKEIIKPSRPQEFVFLKNKEYQIPKHNKSFRRYLEEEPGNSQNNYNSQKNIGNSDNNNNRQIGTIRLKAPSVHEALKSLNLSKQLGSRKRANRSFSSQQMKQDIVFKDPEHNSTRQVVFIKTYILSPFQSISIEISILHQSLIITGYLIGQQKETLKLILNAQKSQKLISESFGDWDLIGKRIYVETAQNGQKSLRIAPLKNVFASIIKHEMQKIQANPLASSKQKQAKLRHQKLRYQKQQQFIRRNYYSVKLQKNNQTINTNQNSTTQNTINHHQNLKDKEINQFVLEAKQQKNFNFQGHLMRLSKQLNYLSPQIKVKAQIIREQKQKSLTKQQINEEMLKKEELMKNQMMAVQRLSKPKKVPNEGITDKSKEKTGPVKLNSLKNQFIKQIIVKKPTLKALIKNHLQRQNQKQKSFNSKINEKDITQHKNDLHSNEQTHQHKKSLNSSHKQLNQDEFQSELLKRQAQNERSYEKQSQQEGKYSQFEDYRSVEDKNKQEKQKIILGRTQSKDFGEDQSQYNINSFIKSSQSTVKNLKSSKIVDRTHAKQQKIHLTQFGFHSKDNIKLLQNKAADKFADDDYEQLIRDIDDEYDNSFDQFKEEPQSYNLQSKIFIQVSQKSQDNKKQHEQILDNVEDDYAEAQFEEDISSQKNNKKRTENQQIQQNDLYPSDNQQIQQNDQVYEDSFIPSEGQQLIISKKKSKVIEQQEYLDEQFDN